MIPDNPHHSRRRTILAILAMALLPLRIVTNRNRGASFLSIGIAGAAIFAVFLFLTYYLQQLRGYTPLETGVAFLPLSAAIMISAITATTRFRMRTGPRPLMVAGMLLAGAGTLYLTGLTVASSYPCIAWLDAERRAVDRGREHEAQPHAEHYQRRQDGAGVQSASVSAPQQVGGSLGTALLSTIAASALTSVMTSAGAHPSGLSLAHAAVHGATTAFTWAALIFGAGALIAASLYERGTKALRVEATARPQPTEA